jgi:Domain of unknown function (DUF4386)
MMSQAKPDTNWRPLYRVGGLAALITAVLIPAQIIVFIVWPPPFEGTASEWFTLFQDNWLLGLLSLDLLLIIDYVLLVPIVLALYVALRRASESLMAVATALYFVAIAAYFASNTAFEMLSLSEGYAAATTESQRTMYLAAGQTMLATFEGTAFQVSYVLASFAGIIIGAVMLRSDIFSRVAAYALILGDVIGLGLYVPTIGIYLSVISVPVLWVWYVLTARRLIQLGSGVSEEEVELHQS